jgi:hypothetical protein
MSAVTARPTNHGTVMLAITDGEGRPAHVELPRSKQHSLQPAPITGRSPRSQGAIHGWKRINFLGMSAGETREGPAAALRAKGLKRCPSHSSLIPAARITARQRSTARA